MTIEEQNEIDEALEGLLAFEKRIVQYGADLLADGNNDLLSPAVLEAIGKLSRIKDYIDYLAMEIVDSNGGRGKALALTIMNVLLLDLEYFFRVAVDGLPAEAVVAEEGRRRAEHMRAFIERKPASFYDDIIARVFQDHVEAHGPWKDRPSRLARKLKPEIDRRAMIDGGKALEQDTITRRLKMLMTPTQH